MAVHHCHLKANGDWKGVLQHPKHPPESATAGGPVLAKFLPKSIRGDHFLGDRFWCDMCRAVYGVH